MYDSSVTCPVVPVEIALIVFLRQFPFYNIIKILGEIWLLGVGWKVNMHAFSPLYKLKHFLTSEIK